MADLQSPHGKGVFGLTELYNGDDHGSPARVDIVAVHGIGADPIHTWAAKGVNWLCDPEMLPRELPDSRIACFGYESQWLGQQAIQQRLPNVAHSLLHALKTYRKECAKRPMILLGHCFGGLVVEKAVLEASVYDHDYPDLFQAVRGVVTLGTPHRGSGSQSAASRIATIASSFGYGEKKSLLAEIGQESEVLADLVHTFARKAITNNIHVMCFFEQQHSDVLKLLRPAYMSWPSKKEMVVDEESACIPGMRRLGIASNHFQMHRYTEPKDANYRAVSSEITQLVHSGLNELLTRSRTEQTFTDNDQAALHAILQSDPRDDLQRIQSRMDSSASTMTTWIQDLEMYRDWLNGEAEPILWLHGSPGKGKTTIAASMLQLMQSAHRSRNELAYFFCNNDDPRRRSASSIVRGLLYSLCVDNVECCKMLTREYERHREGMIESQNALETLWRVFHEVLKAGKFDRLVILIDALDECDVESVESFLVLLTSYSSKRGVSDTASRKPNVYVNQRVRWFITSRDEEAISMHLQGNPAISLEEHSLEIERAVEIFIENQVASLARLKGYDEKLRLFVKSTLREKAEATFLWVAMVCDELSRPRVRALNTRSVLTKFPSGLEQLYRRIFDRIMGKEDADDEYEDELIEYAKQILNAMALAFRPLTLTELAIAADLPPDMWLSPESILDCLKICGSLVYVHDTIVQFVHQTAKAFVAKAEAVVQKDAKNDHERMALRCFNILFDPQIDDAEIPLPNLDQLNYQIQFWPNHARLASSSFTDHMLQTREFVEDNSHSRQRWYSHHWRLTRRVWEEQPQNMSLLIVCAYLSLPLAVESLCQSRASSIDEPDSFGTTALTWATKNGDSQSAEILLNHGAKCDVRNSGDETASYWAAGNGHKDILEQLVAHNANLHVADRMGWTPIHRAVNSAHTSTVDVLVKHMTSLEIKDNASWTPLQRASSNGQVAILETLLKADANAEVVDREGMTPLQTAAWNGHTATVAKLLSRGASLEKRDNEAWTALHHASWAGHRDTVDLLLSRGAEVDARNHEHNTPLFLATWNGHLSIVNCLLQHGAQVDCTCAESETALMQAAWAGHCPIIRLLIDKGASVNKVTPSGISALHQASSNGQQEAAQVLLEAGADSRLEDAEGQTALQYAQENSYDTTAQLLLESGSPIADRGDFQTQAMDQVATILDSAVAEVLSIKSDRCLVLPHGHACSSSPWKVQPLDSPARKYFLKTTSISDTMFEGEFESLMAVKATMPSICPGPIIYGNLKDSPGIFLLTEFVDVSARPSAQNRTQPLSFARKLAKLHLASPNTDRSSRDRPFGFHVETCAGPIPQRNDWTSSWSEFYANNRLRHVAMMVAARHHGEDLLVKQVERVAVEVVPKLLDDAHLNEGKGIKPSLVHGDLWSGNKARGVIYDADGHHDGIQDYVFDASCCYAHSEYELGLMRMFGGFSAGFFSEYHKLVPKTAPVAEYEDRMLLYQLYHWLINYAISGGGFKDEALDCIDKLLLKYGSS